MNDCIDVKIYYEDTDCGGVVYYGKYLAYLERARTEYLEDRGIKLAELMYEGINFVVVHVNISYKMPAKYGDVLSVCSEVQEKASASVIFSHKIYRKGTKEVIAVATVRLACVDRGLRPIKMKSFVADALEREL
ncbi:MAG: YbgC/FadM family acyl-CoA thioesterase [Nitrospirota bacterium]|nr:MAG: YbgC/FadM family acyl-CoA thioesterase [Nitrospirota bacterium]